MSTHQYDPPDQLRVLKPLPGKKFASENRDIYRVILLFLVSTVLAAIAVFALAKFTWTSPNLSKPIARPTATVEDDVFEALFRYQMKNHRFSTAPPAYFLLIQGHDPSLELLQRFANNETPVLTKSQTDSRHRGMTLSITSWEFVSDDEVKVDARHQMGIGGGENQYILLRQNGQWSVSNVVPGMVY